MAHWLLCGIPENRLKIPLPNADRGSLPGGIDSAGEGGER
jgi:hypothetical protein